MKVRSLENIPGLLKKGKEYEVIKENSDRYWIYDDSGDSSDLYKVRFEIVEEQLPEEYIVDAGDNIEHKKEVFTALNLFLPEVKRYISFGMPNGGISYRFFGFYEELDGNTRVDNDIEVLKQGLPIFSYEEWKRLYNKNTKTNKNTKNMSNFKMHDKVKLKSSYNKSKITGSVASIKQGGIYTINNIEHGKIGLEGNLYMQDENLFELAEVKEIIGYKAPKSFVGTTDFVEKGSIFTKEGQEFFYTNNGVVIKKNPLPKEIVEDWEPVYKEEDLLITIPINEDDMHLRINSVGVIEFQFSKRRDRESRGNATIKQLEEVYKYYNYGAPLIGTLNTKSKNVHIGCSSGVDLEISVIENIIIQYKKYFNK